MSRLPQLEHCFSAAAALCHGLRQRLQQRLALLQQDKRGAARRTRPQARKLRQQLDKPLNLLSRGEPAMIANLDTR